MAPLAEASATPAVEPATVLKQKMIEEPQVEAPCEEDEATADDAKTQQETAAAESADVQEPAKKRVRFDVADVVEFEPTMWTATVSSEGVPVSPYSSQYISAYDRKMLTMCLI
jgi:hypothetical protein